MAGGWLGLAAAAALASGCARAGAEEPREARPARGLEGEAWSLVQQALVRGASPQGALGAEGVPQAPVLTAPKFDAHAEALSRMLYGFFMLASCPQLLTERQRQGSGCPHCGAAGFRYVPGELRIIQLRSEFEARDNVAVVARLHATGRYRGGCALAIRGTQTMGNILSNLDFMPTAFPNCIGCLVHDGWLRQWNTLRPHVFEKLSELGCDAPGQALYITGHSSGCPLGDYAAMQLRKDRGMSVAASISFNCPKPGNWAFAQAFEETFPNNVWKVQVEWDPIRHLPPAWTGYVDVGWTVQYLHGGSQEGYHVCGKGGALCSGETPLSFGSHASDMDWWASLANEINSFHCAAPHPEAWHNQAYLRCDAACDAKLLEPDWELLDIKEDMPTQAAASSKAANGTLVPFGAGWLAAGGLNWSKTIKDVRRFVEGVANASRAWSPPRYGAAAFKPNVSSMWRPPNISSMWRPPAGSVWTPAAGRSSQGPPDSSTVQAKGGSGAFHWPQPPAQWPAPRWLRPPQAQVPAAAAQPPAHPPAAWPPKVHWPALPKAEWPKGLQGPKLPKLPHLPKLPKLPQRPHWHLPKAKPGAAEPSAAEAA
mmetsp:Transcript_102482/g.298943  ORF Transcript_102482/g.298943 Transcript_102482/m.298943 type:complete len:596 (+) Transcript_102482:84-1871(+)